MNAEAIRSAQAAASRRAQRQGEADDSVADAVFFLGEIAAQLAEMNKNLDQIAEHLPPVPR
jgi:hypothetical protein